MSPEDVIKLLLNAKSDFQRRKILLSVECDLNKLGVEIYNVMHKALDSGTNQIFEELIKVNLFLYAHKLFPSSDSTPEDTSRFIEFLMRMDVESIEHLLDVHSSDLDERFYGLIVNLAFYLSKDAVTIGSKKGITLKHINKLAKSLLIIRKRINFQLNPEFAFLEAFICYRGKEYENAATLFTFIIKESRPDGDIRLLELTHFNLAEIRMAQGQYEDAIYHYEHALDICEKHSLDSSKEEIIINIGRALIKNGDFEKAIKHFEENTKILGQDLSDFYLAQCYRHQGDFLKSEQLLSLILKRELIKGDFKRILRTKSELMLLLTMQGKFQKALNIAEKIKDKFSEIDDNDFRAKFYGNLGALYINLGKFDIGIELSTNALHLHQFLNDFSGVVTDTSNLVKAFVETGHFMEAILLLNPLLEKTISQNSKRDLLSLLSLKYFILSNTPDIKNTIETLNLTIDLSREIGSGEQLVISLLNRALFKIDSLDEAEKDCNEGLEIIRVQKLLLYQDYGNFIKGKINFKRKLTPSALIDLIKVIERWDRWNVNSKVRGAIFVLNQADDLKELSILNRASEVILDSLESDINLLSDPYMIEEWLHKNMNIYEKIIEASIKTKNFNLAFSAADACRTRSYLALFPPQMPVSTLAPSDLVQKEAELVENISAIAAQLLDYEKNPLAAVMKKSIDIINLRQRMDSDRQQLEIIWKNLEKYDQIFVANRRGSITSIPHIYSQLASTNKNSGIFELFIGEKQMICFFIDKTGVKKSYSLNVSQEMLSYLAELFPIEATLSCEFGKIPYGIHELYNLLISPISNNLEGIEILYFIPHGPLVGVQLSDIFSLRCKKAPFIVNSPSATVLYRCLQRKQIQRDKMVAISYDFSKEGEIVTNICNGIHLKNPDSIEEVRKLCESANIIHFSCHGMFDYQDPLNSGLILFKDGILSAREISKWNLRSSLVFISACSTGKTRKLVGDEFIGLVGSFLRAGSRTVIASPRPVDAELSEACSQFFYEHFWAGESISSSLAIAKTKVLTSNCGSHTNNWITISKLPFMVFGAD